MARLPIRGIICHEVIADGQNSKARGIYLLFFSKARGICLEVIVDEYNSL